MITIEPVPPKISRAGALRRNVLTRFIACAASAIKLDGKVSVLLAGDDRIRELNSRFRGKHQSTDVLSFPAAPHFPGHSSGHSSGHGHAGDLAISIETAARQAGEHGHSLETEVKVLLLHGMLHLAGYDHAADSGEMAREETRLRKKLALPPGLIERGRLPAKRAPASRPARPRNAAAAGRASRDSRSKSR